LPGSHALFAAQEVIQSIDDNGLGYIERANDLARFGLAEARRSALSLRSDVIEESGLVEATANVGRAFVVSPVGTLQFRSNGVRKKAYRFTSNKISFAFAQEADQ